MTPVASMIETRNGRRRGCSRIAAAGQRRPVVDALVVGAGPAGLSTALVLGRARRQVLVLDTGRPANAKALQVGGLLGQSGVSPLDLRRAGRAQLAEHPNVSFRDTGATAVERHGAGFLVTLEDGSVVETGALVLAHGLLYDPPPLPGIEPLWGRSVFHCPFCDGWEVRDRPLAVHGNGAAAAESALFVSGWSRDVVLCTDGPADLGDQGRALAAAGVRVREEPIQRLAGRHGRLTEIEFMSGAPELRDALFVRTRREQPNGIPGALGLAMSAGGTIETDVDGRTSRAGVFAAGDAATDHSRSVANAMGTGARVGYAVTVELATALA